MHEGGGGGGDGDEVEAAFAALGVREEEEEEEGLGCKQVTIVRRKGVRVGGEGVSVQPVPVWRRG